jgi:hypothetical protein
MMGPSNKVTGVHKPKNNLRKPHRGGIVATVAGPAAPTELEQIQGNAATINMSLLRSWPTADRYSRQRQGRPNQPVERMAAGARCLRHRAPWAAATAHFFRSPHKMRALGYVMVGALVLLATSCKHTPPAPPVRLSEYGTPGPGKLKVRVRGDVPHPGEYWVSEGATLVTLEEVLGIRGDVHQLWVTLARQSEGGYELRCDWRLDHMPQTGLGVVLADEDTLRYYDMTLYTCLVRCPESAAPRVKAILDEADITYVETMRNWGRNSRGFSVRFDQGFFAEVLLQGNPQLVGYKIEFLPYGGPALHRTLWERRT